MTSTGGRLIFIGPSVVGRQSTVSRDAQGSHSVFASADAFTVSWQRPRPRTSALRLGVCVGFSK